MKINEFLGLKGANELGRQRSKYLGHMSPDIL